MGDKKNKENYKGIVISPFKTKKKEYNIGDYYTTTCLDSFNTLINSKRIKK